MPEPNFDHWADVCLSRFYETRHKGLIAEHDVVVEHLRKVWNARGAADLAIKRRWATDQEAAIRALDR